MITFLIGLVILIGGGALYGKFCEKVFAPTERETPALKLANGMDYVPMERWRNHLIELLNIAGTGPVLGPIQGILFGPIAFLTIPVGCVLGGAFHDYMNGMISLRHNGEQMPALVHRFLGGGTSSVYHVIVCLSLLLFAAVLVYTPGDLFVTQFLNEDASELGVDLLAVYAVIFAYYLTATLLPIDKVIGKIYPLFGLVLLLSAVGIFLGIFLFDYPLYNVWDTGFFGVHPFGENFIPIFFITVACGIVSGFHSTQATIISRTLAHEKDGRFVFYNAMIAEGFIAMTWAAGAMGAWNLGLADSSMLHDKPVAMVGLIAKDILGNMGGSIAVVGVIILSITSGDTALRSLRIILGDAFNIDQTKKRNILAMAGIIFVALVAVLFTAKTNPSGFSILWRYFSWANETIAVFAFSMIAVYMMRNGLPYLMAIIPGAFYMYIICAYILHAQIGFGFSWELSYALAAVLDILFVISLIRYGKK